MKINSNNYEAFVLDYIEGNLSAEDRDLLFAFIAAHPELAVDFDVPVQPIPESVHSNHWNHLLVDEQHTLPQTVDFALVARLEGDVFPGLTPDLGDPQIANTFAYICATKLESSHEVFTNASDLLIPNTIETFEQWKVAVAEGDLQQHPLSMRAVAMDETYRAEYSNFRLNAPDIRFADKEALLQNPRVIPFFTRIAIGGTAAAAVFIAVLNIPLAPDHSGQQLGEVTDLSHTRAAFIRTSAPNDSSVKATSGATPNQWHTVDPPLAISANQAPIAEMKLKTVRVMANAMDAEKSLLISPETIAVVLPTEEPTLVAATDDSYQTVGQYVLTKSRQDLLKVDDDEEPIALALVERAIDKIETNSNGAVVLEPPLKKQPNHSFFFKVGKLEVSRNH